MVGYKKCCRKLASCLCAALLFLLLPFRDVALAEEGTTGQQVVPKRLYAYAACLYDAKQGRVLFEQHGEERLAMASTTKIMTLIVILENASMDDVVTVSKNAASQPDVQLNIREGEQYRLGDLVYSLMLESHNDTAVALAEHVGGSVEGFCGMMNAKAAELGLVDTCFETPNGLDGENHYTTAVELAKIAAYAIQNEEFRKITNTTSYQFDELTGGRSCMVTNKNRFLYMMEGAIGVKTGFTGKAGYCFVGAIDRGDYQLVSVVLACGWPPNKTYKWSDTRALMEYGLEYFKKRDIADTMDVYCNGVLYAGGGGNMLSQLIPQCIPVEGGISSGVDVAVPEFEIPKLLLADWETGRAELEYISGLTAPVGEGQLVGEVSFYVGDTKIGQAPLKTAGAVSTPSFLYCIRKVIEAWINI